MLSIVQYILANNPPVEIPSKEIDWIYSATAC